MAKITLLLLVICFTLVALLTCNITKFGTKGTSSFVSLLWNLISSITYPTVKCCGIYHQIYMHWILIIRVVLLEIYHTSYTCIYTQRICIRVVIQLYVYMLLCTYSNMFVVLVPFTPARLYARLFTWGFRFYVCNRFDLASLANHKGGFLGPHLLTLISYTSTKLREWTSW